MAAEVPVCDVLCEAMEYLSKLGSNLRSRSENLKEKRISKNKLRNAHAVHKAANKVLLICELSKKSLENVETGVRKVLSLVSASQEHTNDGGKKSDKKIQDNNKKFYYFNYESCKLRISKKISIDHFTSVKVVANGMPASIQNKYPVFYDCKLKRLRRKLSEKQSDEELGRSSKREDSFSSDTNQDIEKSKKIQSAFLKLLESDASESEKFSKNEDARKKITDSNKSKTGPRKSLDVLNSNPEDVIDDKTNNTISTDSLNTLDDKSQSEQGPGEQNNINLTSDQDAVNSKDDLAVSELIECFANEAKVVEDKSNKVKTKSIRKKFSKITIADDSSDSDEHTKNKPQDTELNKHQSSPCKEDEINVNNTTELEPKSKKRKFSDSGDNLKPKDDSDDNSRETNISENGSKPLIRCVNITKLLKPDVLGSKISESYKGKQMTKNDHLMKKGRVRKSSVNCNNVQKKDGTARKTNCDKEKQSDEEFWSLKRNEVKQFKPKQFNVNMNKLPQLTISFLLKHNLRRIICGSKTICEVKKAKEKQSDNFEKNIDEVKNALLNESGSDDIDDTLAVEANKVKNTLLNDSDSDAKEQASENTENSNQTNKDKLTDTSAIKDALLNESDSENNELDKVDKNEAKDAAAYGGKELEKEAAEKIKSALLNDSDSDKNQSDNTVDKPNDSVTDKNIGEKESGSTKQCENIKSALLNDSDSDKNQSNNSVDKPSDSGTVKNIRDKKSGSTEQCENIKSALLNDSDSDKNQSNNTVDKPNDSGTDKNIGEKESGSTQQCNLTQDPDKIKSSLLDDSSDNRSESPVIIKKKKLKTKHKRKDAIKSRQARKSILNSSTSSENEENSQESDKDFKKKTHKHSRRKTRISSSSSDDRNKKQNSSRESDPQDKKSKANSGSEDKDSQTIDQIDGTIDEHSNSSVSKVGT